MKTTLSIIRNLSARTLASSGVVATTLSTFATPASASVLNNRVFQLEVAKRGPNGEALCLAVDVSKIGVLSGANRAKVEPYRNIAEQQFRTVHVDNTYFRIQTAHAAPDGQAKCLDTNVTKIGVVAGANQSYFGNCANIQEQLYSKFRHDYANPVRQLLKVGTTSPHYCLDIDGSKYGVLPEAQFAKFGGCARVDEQWITFRSLSALTPVPTGWRHLLLGTGHALNTNFGSRFHNAQFNRPAVGLWQAVSGDPDQFFRFEPQLNGSYLVRNNKTGLCMDSTTNPQAGSKAIVHDRNPGNTNQFWDPLPQGNNVYLLQRSGTNLCLDSTGQNVDGTHTHLWPCDGGNGNQRFASAYVAPPANQPPSNNGSGGSDGPTLIRSGGITFVDIVINGVIYGARQILGFFITNGYIIDRVENGDYHHIFHKDNDGEKSIYISKWGAYTRLSGDQLDEAIARLDATGEGFAEFTGGLLGIAAGGVTYLSTGDASSGLAWGGSIALTNIGASKVVVGLSLIELKDCDADTGTAYVRQHLISGSWKESKKLLPFQGPAAYAMRYSISCY